MSYRRISAVLRHVRNSRLLRKEGASVFHPPSRLPNTPVRYRGLPFLSSSKTRIRKTGKRFSFSSFWILLPFFSFFSFLDIRLFPSEDAALHLGGRFFFFFSLLKRRQEGNCKGMPLLSRNFPSERRKASGTEKYIRSRENASEAKSGAFFFFAFFVFSFDSQPPSFTGGKRRREKAPSLFRLTDIFLFFEKRERKKNVSCGMQIEKEEGRKG